MNNGVILSEVVLEGNTLTHKTSQPTEQLILARNAELRKNPGVLRDLSFGRQLASIPMIMYEKAIRDGFDLNNKDSDISGREMFRYLQTPEGRACLVQPIKEGSKNVW